MHELLERSGNVEICLPVKVVFVFALGWNSADFLCTTEMLLCFVQECKETWDKIARKQIADEKYGTIDPKKGKAEAENVDNMHEPSDIENGRRMSSRVGRLGCMRASCGPLEQYLYASIRLKLSAMVTVSDNVFASWS